MTEPAIVVDQVTKLFRIYQERNQSIKSMVLRGRRSKYEEFAAVKDVSFEVQHGRTFGIVGSNGSGKSTLLKCIARILQPNSGRIITNGRMAAMLEVGSGFHSELSGRENIYLNGAILGMSKKEIDAKFDTIVDFSGVERFIDTPVKNYSSGMYVRLGFSVAIHTVPEILVVDEVFSVGDAEFQRKSRAKFDELKAAGTTIVLVSHNNGLIRSFCDDLAWLEKGVLRRVGDVESVLEEFQGPSSSKPAQKYEGDKVLSGAGPVQITSMGVFADSGEPISEIDPEQPIRLRLSFESDQACTNVQFTLSVTDLEGRMRYRMNSRELGWDVGEIPPGPGYVDVPLRNLPLAAGEYQLNGDVREAAAKSTWHNARRVFTFRVRRGQYQSTRSALQLPTVPELRHDEPRSGT